MGLPCHSAYPPGVLPPEPSCLPHCEAVKQHEQEPRLAASAELCAKGQCQLPGGKCSQRCQSHSNAFSPVLLSYMGIFPAASAV